MSFEECPELSVIVPVYNEEGNLIPFLSGISRQREVRLEVIVSDGASTDGSVEAALKYAEDAPFKVRVIGGGKGRGGQLNRGAEMAQAATLLFLHVDSGFEDPLALRKGLDALRVAAREGGKVAGRFALRFEFEGEAPLPYRFYGAKATLDRPGCTHGDQGFMLSREFFYQAGPYDTTLPLMEDTFLAERVREVGRWLLFPSRINTSPRRFLAEGLLPRQTLNAILMNLAGIGQLSLIHSLKRSYRSQDTARRLRLQPFLVQIGERLAAYPPRERWRFWCRTGSYVRSNAWQIPFFLDLLTGAVSEGKGGRCLALHDRLLGRAIDNRAGNWCAALLTWLWFRLTLYASH